jgi:hypothetical protein
MTDQTPNPSGGKPRGPASSPMRFVVPIVLGLIGGSAIYYGYQIWAHRGPAPQPAEATAGDPDLAKPAADDCAMARAAAAAVHSAGDDKQWESGAGVTSITLGDHTKVINPADFAGISDDEAADLNSRAPADWRWCPGMSAFISGFGWNAMGSDYPVATLALSRAAVDKAGDQAVMYEAFMAQKEGSGVLGLAKGPWLVTLRKGPGGAWVVASRDDLKRYVSSPGH